jgi:hypothetical protein
MVAVSNDLTEASARESVKNVQAKFRQIVGKRQPVIRSVDLGKSRLFFRAELGPFSTAADAIKFCQMMRRAGGSCIAVEENKSLDPRLLDPLPEGQKKSHQ